MPLSVSIVMPALNEENNVSAAVKNTLAAFAGLRIEGEVVVVNDGSTDRTPERVKEIMSGEGPRVRLVEHAAPLGIGRSFWDGVDAARNEIVAMFPGDNENDPRESLRYLDLLNHVDIVVPFVVNREVRSAARNLLSGLFRLIVNATFGTNFNYTNGTVLYRRALLKDLSCRSEGFFFQTDALVRLVRRGYLFAEVPCRLGSRKGGRSKALSLKSLRVVASGYLRLLCDRLAGKLAPGPLSPNSVTSKRGASDRPVRSRA